MRTIFFLLSAMLFLAMDLSAQSVPVFVYHRFGDDRYPATNIPVDVFEKHLTYLADNDFTVLTLSDALNRMDSGTLPEKPVVLTVDDGYSSFYKNALPLLNKYDIPATLFVNTAHVGGDDFMSWKQLEMAQKAGVEIGNHSHNHPQFLNEDKPLKLFEKDVKRAQSLFKRHLNFIPTLFSYPYGEYTANLQEKAQDMGFEAATAQRSGVMHKKGDRFAIPRFPMGGPFASLSSFKEKAGMMALRTEVLSPSSTTDTAASVFRFRTKSEVVSGTLQCFIDGKKTSLQPNEDSWQVELPELTHRRTLITLTGQIKNSGKYGWFSFVLINTRFEEP